MGESPLQRALRDYLQKWYPDLVIEKESQCGTSLVPEISVDALKIDIVRSVRLESMNFLKKEIKEIKELEDGIQD